MQSRYYNPEIGRFINADSLVSTGQGILGYNMFAYCLNNPVNALDDSGHFAISAVLIGAAIGFFTAYIPDVLEQMQDGFEWSDFNTFEENTLKYLGATLGGAVGGFGSALGCGLGGTMLANGLGNVIESAFSGGITTVGDALDQFVVGGILGGIGYGSSKKITQKFANKKIFGI